MAIYSQRDSRGVIFVDCSECERGANGSEKDKYSCGWRTKKGGKGGCFMGTLIPSVREKMEVA
jgi:hypothetical protein